MCNTVTKFARKISQRITDFSVLPIKKFRSTWKSRSTKGLLSYNRSRGFVVDVKVSRCIFENIRGFPNKISECKKENTLQSTVEIIKLSAQMSYAITRKHFGWRLWNVGPSHNPCSCVDWKYMNSSFAQLERAGHEILSVWCHTRAFDGSLQGENKGKVGLKNNRYLSFAKIAPVKPNGEVLSIWREKKTNK